MTNPIGTKEQREELRQPRDKWRTRIAPYSTTTYLRSALDGLDTAQEMARQMALWRGNKPPNYCAVLAEWNRWLKGGSP